uniref:Uncharacterized protein n=1 Tax=Timema monikensis TaxID=170555 RepID=A0A7R9HQ27_9NEOP|nr:unnamed protein product [Timema monikensis]
MKGQKLYREGSTGVSRRFSGCAMKGQPVCRERSAGVPQRDVGLTLVEAVVVMVVAIMTMLECSGSGSGSGSDPKRAILGPLGLVCAAVLVVSAAASYIMWGRRDEEVTTPVRDSRSDMPGDNPPEHRKFTSDLHNGALKVLVAPRVPLRSRGTPADDLSDWHSVVHNSLGGLFYPNDEFQSQSITSTFIDIRAHKITTEPRSTEATSAALLGPRVVVITELEDDSDSSSKAESSEEEDDSRWTEVGKGSDVPTEYWHIQKLVKYMKAGNQTATIVALCCLKDQTLTTEISQIAIRDIGGLEVLVNLLETEDLKCKLGALSVLSQISVNTEIRRTITDLGGVPLLVDILSHPARDLQILAAETIANIAKVRKARKIVRKCGGIPKLVSMCCGLCLD